MQVHFTYKATECGRKARCSYYQLTLLPVRNSAGKLLGYTEYMQPMFCITSLKDARATAALMAKLDANL